MKNRKMKNTFLGLTATAVLLTGLFIYTPAVFADLLIMPIRIVFKDRDRMKNLTLANTSENEATFKFQFYHQTQSTNGSYLVQSAPADSKYDLSKMLVFSPRRVQLPSRGKQAIRLSVRRPEDLPDGEYRTHLKIERVRDEKQRKSAASGSAKGARAAMFVNVSFSIPIMLRKGKYDSTATISDFKYTPSPDGKKPPRVNFALNRKGKYSTLGRVLVFWTDPSGKERRVGIKNGLNVFTEINRRDVYVDLTENNISGGKFRVVFDGDDADEGIKFDEKVFPVTG